MSSHLRRLAALAAVVAVCAVIGCTDVRVGVGGGGAFVSFTIGGKTFTFTLGSQNVFNVQAGVEPARSAVRVENLFETNQTPTDRPGAGRLLLDQSQVRVTPLGTDKAIGPMQGVTGTYDVLVRMADVGEDSPCSNGTEVGTFRITATNGVVAIEATGLDLPADVLEAVLTGMFSICLEISGTADATVVIESLGVWFAETTQPVENDNDSGQGTGWDDQLTNDNMAEPVDGNENAAEPPTENDNEAEPPPTPDAVAFAPAVAYGLPVEVSPYCLVVANFDQDVDVDVAVGSFFSDDEMFATFLNTGDGSLGSPQLHNVGDGYAGELDTGDFNGDGYVDIAVINNWFHGFEVWLGDGSGSFSVAGEYETGWNRLPTSITAADFNGDGLDDLATCHQYDNEMTVMINQGGGTFLEPDFLPIYAVGSLPTYLTNADMDRDGDIDVIVFNDGHSGLGEVGDISYMANTGDGTFVEWERLEDTGTLPSSLAIADTDGDNDLDIIVVGGGAGGGPGPDGIWPSVTVIVGGGTGIFSEPLPSYVGDWSYSRVATGDLDLDGDVDLALAAGHVVTVALNTGAGVFDETAYDFEVEPNVMWVAVADMDGDGDLDIVASNGSRWLGESDHLGSVSVLLNQAVP